MAARCAKHVGELHDTQKAEGDVFLEIPCSTCSAWNAQAHTVQASNNPFPRAFPSNSERLLCIGILNHQISRQSHFLSVPFLECRSPGRKLRSKRGSCVIACRRCSQSLWKTATCCGLAQPQAGTAYCRATRSDSGESAADMPINRRAVHSSQVFSCHTPAHQGSDGQLGG